MTNVIDLFIPPNQVVENGHADYIRHINATKRDLRERWRTDKGKEILKLLKDNNFDRHTLASVVGVFNKKFDLRSIPIDNIDLSGTDLCYVDFFDARFKKVNFERANFSHSHLSEVRVARTNFNHATFDGTLWDNISFDQKTTFVGVDIDSMNLTLAEMLRTHIIGQWRIEHLERQHPVFAKFVNCTSNYGRSPMRWGLFSLIVTAGFAVLYQSFPITKPPIQNYVDAMYFSIVTFTTVGFGDIVPNTLWGRIVASVEAVVGYVMAGVFVAIVIRRIMSMQ